MKLRGANSDPQSLARVGKSRRLDRPVSSKHRATETTMYRRLSASRSFLAIACVATAAAGFIIGSSAEPSSASIALQEGMQDMPPEMLAMMERWESLGELRPEHEAMHDSAGTWLIESEWFTAPGAPPEEQLMMAKIRPIMGGRYMYEEISALMQNPDGTRSPWTAVAISGYDNRLAKHSFVWIDNTGTSMTVGYGDQTAPDEWTYEYSAYDMMADAMVERKNIINKLGPDSHTFEMHTRMPDGTWFKNMEMSYSRAQ